MRNALDECYGKDKVSLVNASFRWLNHHSLMKPDYGGKLFHGILPQHLHILFWLLDGIIIGASRLEHIIDNIAVCSEGPLDDSK